MITHVMRAFRPSFFNDHILICTFLPRFLFCFSSWMHKYSFLHKTTRACWSTIKWQKNAHSSISDGDQEKSLLWWQKKRDSDSLLRVQHINTSTCCFFQFYKCFLILFHCGHWSADNGNTSMPSKTTAIQLNRRVYSNTVACANHLSTGALQQCCSANTISTKNTSTIEGKLSWTRRKRLAHFLRGPRTKPLSISALHKCT